MTDPADRAGAVLTIDLDAIVANYRLLQARLKPGARAGAVVKADAYGLGAATVAPVLAAAGCTTFFVALLDEGIALRPHLPADCDIVVLNGLMPKAERAALAHGLIPVLNSLEQVDGWAALARREQRALPAFIQLDSGMSRLGLQPRDLDRLVADPARLGGIELRAVMSHLAVAERQDHPANERQLAAFEAGRARLPAAPASFANSSGIFLGPRYHFDLVRPGAALYGIAPVAGAANPMRPVIRLQGKVVQLREIGAGDAVGYGLTFEAKGPTRIATLGVGYADGYLRAFSNRAVGHLDGIVLPQVGIVSMDSLTLDVSALPEGRVQPGMLIDLIGPHQTVDEAAGRAGTIAYEILTGLGRRYHRHYTGGIATSKKVAGAAS